MEKKNIDWGNLGFGYVQTDYRFVSDFKNGSWDEGKLTEDATVVINECAGVLQYAQTVFEGMKAYTTEDGRIVTFRPDLNAERMENSAKRLEMPVFPKDRFIQAVVDTVKANAAYVPPFGSGATLYIRPYMFGTNPVIGVKPADEYQFRVFTTPVGPYFKGGVKPLTIRVTDFDRAAPHGTGHIKAGLNYAMSMHAIMDAHRQGYDENMYLDAATRTKVEETGGGGIAFVLIYMRDTSTGGADFVLMAIHKAKPHISVGKIIIVMDFIIVIIGGILMRGNIDKIIYGLIGTYILSFVVDKLMYGVDAGKLALIVTEKGPQIALN